MDNTTHQAQLLMWLDISLRILTNGVLNSFYRSPETGNLVKTSLFFYVVSHIKYIVYFSTLNI